jgi:hypothetical protein
MWPDPFPTDVSQISKTANLLSKVVFPALATLVPTAATAFAKWAGNQSRERRSTELTTRISGLSKSISELPEVPLTGANPGLTPRLALTAELEVAVLELTALQVRASHHLHGFSTFATRVRAALLLYKPKGFAAWSLHIAFYLYSVFLIIVLLIVVSDDSAPAVNTKSAGGFFTDLTAFIFIFGLLGIPPMIMRYYATKIHRRQCSAALAGVPPETVTTLA